MKTESQRLVVGLVFIQAPGILLSLTIEPIIQFSGQDTSIGRITIIVGLAAASLLCGFGMTIGFALPMVISSRSHKSQ